MKLGNKATLWLFLGAGILGFGCSNPGSGDTLGQRTSRHNPQSLWRMVAAGDGFSCGVLWDRTVVCWGAQMCPIAARKGSQADVRTPKLSGVRAVVVGDSHACALRMDGTLWCWGWLRQSIFRTGGDDQDDGAHACTSQPRHVPGIKGGSSVAAATDRTCVVTGAGRLKCLGETVPSLGAYTKVRQVTLGVRFTCALFQTGQVSCWGTALPGRTCFGDRCHKPAILLNGAVSFSAGYSTHRGRVASEHICAVKRDGSVWCWGHNEHGQLGAPPSVGSCEGDDSLKYACLDTPSRVAGLPPMRSVSAGGDYTCAISRRDGVWCWGENDDGRLGDGTFTRRARPKRVVGIPPVLALTASVQTSSYTTRPWAHTCALSRRRQLWCWGYAGGFRRGRRLREYQWRPMRVAGTLRAQAIAAGAGRTCAVATSGSVWCWGDTLGLGRRTVPTRMPRLAGIQSLTLGDSRSCAIDRSGRTWCWGRNKPGAGQAGSYTSPARVHAKRSVKSRSNTVHKSIKGLSGVKASCRTSSEGLALRSDGTVWQWESNSPDARPTRMATLKGVRSIACGSTGVKFPRAHYCALHRDGSIWCWGHNGDDQLGNGRSLRQPRPVRVRPRR